MNRNGFTQFLLAGLVVAFFANAFVTWRNVAVLENDVAHLTTAIEQLQTDVRGLQGWSDGRPPIR